MKIIALKYFLFFYLIIASLLVHWSCASTGNLTGGDVDKTPPVLDTNISSADKQKNIKPKQLFFYFDEFIELRDPVKQVLVSPPLTYIPKVTHRGKKVTFTFDEKEILKDNATYTINFGEAIVDFHEGNKLENFNFVFTTGDVLDSLSITGKIVNALTGEPESEMIALLYDNHQDSVVLLEKPYYFAKTDKSGRFTFENIKSDTFKLFALKDENLNYRYDLETEKIAFYDSLIILNDTLKKEFTLISSLPKPVLKILTTNHKTYGKVNILLNTAPTEGLPYTIDDPNMMHTHEIISDSLNIYYHQAPDSFYIYILNDTIKVKPKGQEEFLKKSKFKRVLLNNSLQLLPSDSFLMSFNLPIGRFQEEKILLYDTIGQLENVSYKLTPDQKSLVIKYPWVGGEQYTLELDSSVISSIYGQPNDSIGLKFKILKPDKTGGLTVTIRELDSMSAYVVHILKDKTKIYSEVIRQKSEALIVLKGLIPERYDIEIFQDENDNSIWDPGNYWLRRQPEKYRLFKGDKLRENWQTEMNISWKPTSAETPELKNNLNGLQNNLNNKQRQ